MNLSNFETLEKAQAEPQTEHVIFNSNEMSTKLLRCNLFEYFENGTAAIHKLFMMRLATSSRFDFTETDDGMANNYMLSQLIAAENDAATKSKLEALSRICASESITISYPFANATVSQFNSSKGLYSTKAVEYTAGKELIITVNSTLNERVAATLWRVREGFEPVPECRPTYIQNKNKYEVNMAGKRSGSYEVRVPLLGADFRVECI